MLNMKKASVREIQHHFSDILRRIEEGEEVCITKRNKIVAKIVPHSEIQREPVEYPDFVGRAKEICETSRGKPLSDTVIEERNERV
jgi:prevent-host-death family protein